MSHAQRAGWPARARAYGAAVMLNLALVGYAPTAVLHEPTPIVRAVGRRGDRFDRGELIGHELVVTVPAPDARAITDHGVVRFGLN